MSEKNPTPQQANPQKRPKALTRSSVVGPEPVGRYAAFRTPGATGYGERTLPEKMAGYSYEQSVGYKMQDFPLGNPAPRTLEEGLSRCGYELSPSRTMGDPATGQYLEVYDKVATVEFLIVVFSAGLEQLIIAKGFPSLMLLLEKYGPIVERCASGSASASKFDAGEGTMARAVDAGPVAAPNVPAGPVGVRVGDQLAAGHVTLDYALGLTPKRSDAIIHDMNSGKTLYVWDQSQGRWGEAAPEEPSIPENVAGRRSRAADEDGHRYDVVTPDGRVLAHRIPLAQVLKMAPMPHDCNNSRAVEARSGKVVVVYSGPDRKWVDPPTGPAGPPKPLV